MFAFVRRGPRLQEQDIVNPNSLPGLLQARWLPRYAWAAALALCLASQGAAAQAIAAPAPSNVVSLSAGASSEVANDWLTIVFSTAREGGDAQVVQAQLRQALDTALAEARKAARPGQVEVQTGAFALHPRYAPATPRANGGTTPAGIVGWQGAAELIVQGADIPALTKLAGRIQTMTIARTGFSLSRQARDRAEADVTAQAIARFSERADAVTRAFGMRSWALREVTVSGDEPVRPMMQAMVRASATPMAMAEAALPAEAGHALVTVTVSGAVQMAK
jgi:predicted secreted protein